MTLDEYLRLRDAFDDALMEVLDAQFKKTHPKEAWDEYRKPIFEKHLAKYNLEVKTIEE